MNHDPNTPLPAPQDGSEIIARNEFGIYSIPASTSTRPAARVTIAGKVWEKSTIEFMCKNAGNKDIIHAGTFFGDFLPRLSSCLKRDATIWAFEPNPDNFRHAERTIKLNSLNNVVLRMAGLGEVTQSRNLRVIGRRGAVLGGASRFVDYADRVNQEQLTVAELIRIDDSVPADRDVGIIQLDLEGYELKALQGATNTIKRCHPIVIIEANKPTNECVALLATFEYESIGMLGPNLVLATRAKKLQSGDLAVIN